MNKRKSTRNDVIQLLVEYEKSSTSMKTLLRDMQTASIDSPDFSAQTHSLALSVIKYRNTIDFVISRSLKNKTLNDLNTYERNILRAAVYEARWLNTPPADILSYYPAIRNYTHEFENAMTFDLDDATARLPLANRLSLKYSHPTFLVETLLDNLPLDSSTNLLKASNQTRTYYIRPNALLGATNSVIESIVDVRAETDDSLPKVFRVVEGIDSVIRSQAYRDGQVIIQDKGSILIVNALDPKPGQIIWDTCAAPGLKTQLIAERMRGSGRIIATDVYKDRVKVGKKLSKIFNASQIEWVQADAAKPVIHTAEKILIDAPCTSTGSLQSYPSFKWRLNKESLFALMTVQNKILDAILTDYSDKPGTEIVFSTCSLLPHEGESQIDSVMKRHTIKLLTPFEYGDPGYPGFSCSKMVRRLFPHKHACGGFFVAKFKVMQ